MDYKHPYAVDFHDKYWKALRAVDHWIEKHNYSSYDPYDILGTRLILYLRSCPWDPVSIVSSKDDSPSALQKFMKDKLAFFYQSTFFMQLLRISFGVHKTINPKTMGLLSQAYSVLYRLTKEEVYIKKINYCLDWLIKHTNTDFGKYCWGIPYVWQMVRPYYRIPKAAPQSTLTAVNGLAFVDAFEVTQNEKYLEVAVSSCEFFLQNLNVEKIADTQIAFSYTPYDHTHVLNVNLHCGALLSRVWKITKKDVYLDSCIKAANFTISHQRMDGAWHYSSHLDGQVNAVDNYHTGDNLEYLYVIKENIPDFPFEGALKKGLDYYLSKFFLPTGLPKLTDQLIYPADIHSCAQAVITLARLSSYDKHCLPLAQKVTYWALENMRDSDGYFYYRLYDSGNYDKTDFIGWGDSWMVKALALLIASMP